MRLRWVALAFLLLVGIHHEVRACSSLPYTFTDGTVADANQVMSNLNTIISCATTAANITGGSIKIGGPPQYSPGSPLEVKGALGNVIAMTVEGYGSPSSLSTGAAWVQYTDNSKNRSWILDFRATNAAGTVIDESAALNPGLQWWDTGHEESDWDFVGYRNGVEEVMMYLSAGCIMGVNTAANNAGSVGCTGASIAPVLAPGTDAIYNLGFPSMRWNTLYAAGINGNTGGATPPTGDVGEQLTSTPVSCLATVGLTNNTAKTITSIVLSAGTWDITGIAGFNGDAATAVNTLLSSISPTDNTMVNSVESRIATIVMGGTPFLYDRPSAALPTVRVTVSGTTSYYLVSLSVFAGGNLGGCGTLRATRVY
jgi:hypothetical protein